MVAGRDIVDALECVLSIYFSNIRHNLRAAFLLCDELVEVACKAEIRQNQPNAGRLNFHQTLAHPSVGLNPNQSALGASVVQSHLVRNHMQHAVAAATVDDQHCADAIVDAIAVIEHCFPGSTVSMSNSIIVAARVVRIHSSQGNQKLRADFDEEMRNFRWNHPIKRATVKTLPIPVGARQNWGQVITSNNVIVAGMLDRIGAP